MYQFRDPIHGFIEVTELELKIIDSPSFQRLRNIRQLSTTYLVYHGAEHARFGHSIGVMHLVSRAFNSAVKNYERETKEELFCKIDKEWYSQILRIIALVHDLGHAPFSHGSEVLFDDGLEHENFTKEIICGTEIAGYINDIGENFVKEHNAGEKYLITPELIWLIYGNKNPELDKRYIMPDFKFLKSFMDSDLDCDKMDYLLRDSHYCGVNYGKYDLERLLSSLTVHYNSKDKIMQLGIESGGIHAFEEFVIARYFMFIQVYFHKTRRYLDKLLVDCISSVLENSKYPSNLSEYLKLDDEYIIAKIQERADKDLNAGNFVKRKVMSCIYETPAHSFAESDKQLFNAIKKELKNNNFDIIEDDANKFAHKLSPVFEQYDDPDSGKEIPIIDRQLKKPAHILEKSILLQSLRKPINIRRIYVDKGHSEKARNIVYAMLNGEEE